MTSRDAKGKYLCAGHKFLLFTVLLVDCLRFLQTAVASVNTARYDGVGSMNYRHRSTKRYTPCLKKNVPPLACYNFDAHEWILIFFGRNVTDKVGSQKMLYYATSNNLCFCTTWQNGETRKSHFSLNWIVLHAMHLCAIFLKEKMSSVMCLIASNI